MKKIREWYFNGKLYSEWEDNNGEKFTKYPDGTKIWFLNGERHRENGPAVINPDGTKCWYLNGVLHREDGPAIEYSGGRKEWYFNGVLHRLDGPAIEFEMGTKEWYKNGVFHREDGPAIMWNNGVEHWYLGGKKLNISSIDELKEKVNEFYIEKIHNSLRKSQHLNCIYKHEKCDDQKC